MIEPNTLAGLVVIVGALSILTVATLWSRGRINRINDSGCGSARDILQGGNGGTAQTPDD